MADGVMSVAAFAAIWLSFGVLALMQEAHWTAVTGQADGPPPPLPLSLRRWRLCAGAGLALGCALCIAVHGAGFGTLLALLLLGAGAISVAFTLAWKPHWLRGLAAIF
ncbi:DUF3325 family protein [Massilia sp. CCM 8733]|uniref:DUF3325 family protein n=1 Tax=Massilia mucilaginosa TaxID=2609282 RepID=A0ABX0NUH8_9BURK|nr:DUF3325 family protein [Massilia mucilaginosa]NHZ90177.1 DUF3325 family protein [Massilia mucilaginosa]